MPQEAVVNAAVLGPLCHLHASSVALTLDPETTAQQEADWLCGQGRVAKWRAEVWLMTVPACLDPSECEGLPCKPWAPRRMHQQERLQCSSAPPVPGPPHRLQSHPAWRLAQPGLPAYLPSGGGDPPDSGARGQTCPPPLLREPPGAACGAARLGWPSLQGQSRCAPAPDDSSHVTGRPAAAMSLPQWSRVLAPVHCPAPNLEHTIQHSRESGVAAAPSSMPHCSCMDAKPALHSLA